MTTFAGLKVTMKGLQRIRKKGYIDAWFIKDIVKHNDLGTEGKPEGYGLENPEAVLKQALLESTTGKGKKRKNIKNFKSQVEDIQWKRTFKTKEEIFKHNFKDIAKKSMSKEERTELRKMMGWNKGLDPEASGFNWNAETKRLEKKNADGSTSWIKVNTDRGRGKSRYSSRTIEYGTQK